MGDDVGLDLKLMELLPKPPALLSIAASYVFMRELWADRFYRGEKVIPRVLFALAFGGLLRSVGWFLTTWASPKELPYLWLNAGNTATCTFQGFIIHFGLQLCLGMYCFLFVCYLLILRYSWSDYKLARREKWGHGLVLGYAGGSAVLPLFWGMYNNYYPICWIAEYPLGCRGRFSYPDEFTSGGYPCIRGDKGWIVGEVYSYIPIWVTVITGIVTMSMIFCFVRSLERRNAEYAGSRSTQHMTVEMSTTFDRSEQRERPPPEPLYINRKKSRAVAAQAYWYTGTFLAAWALDLVGSTMLYFGTFWWPPLTLVSFTLMPLQPTWNFLVFGRTRDKMKTPEGRFLWKILCCCDCFCLSSTKKKWLKWLRSFSSSSEAEGGGQSSSNTQVRGNKNKNGNNNNNNKTSNSQEMPNKKQQHDNKNGKLSRTSESVEIQFGPDSQFEPQRSRGVVSESVEIAFGPDSQFEESAAVTSTVETTSTTMSSSQFGGYGSGSGHGNISFDYGSNDNNNSNGGGGDMVEDEAPMIATTGDGDTNHHHHRREENHTAADRSNGGVSIIPPQQPADREGGEADASFRDEVVLGKRQRRDNNAAADEATTTGTTEEAFSAARAVAAEEVMMMIRASCGGGRAAVTEVEQQVEDDHDDKSSGRRASF